ncbi:MAG: Cyclic di-GMP phosphodiesterase response regulator RpfG [Planctomycetes bacterium ADurb.Bin412]|nr:MAG: Cyclic di-GMP phosphodiesterase response regulator RpfG [Planctomycetes bacterium ADurb.Bin412]
MEKELAIAESTLDFQSVEEMETFLQSLGIDTAFALAGDLSDPAAGDERAGGGSGCCCWQDCQKILFRDIGNDPEQPVCHEITCSQGYTAMVIPIMQKRQTIGWLACCLKKLRYQKTESLQRICDQLHLDCTYVVEQGLSEALSSSEFGALFRPLLQTLFDKMHAHTESTTEMEALSNSLAQSYEEITLLHRISDGMRVTQEPDTFFAQLCEDLKEFIEVEELLVLWSDCEVPGRAIKMVASSGTTRLSRADLDLLWHRTQYEAEQSLGILIDSNVDRPYTHQWPQQIRNLVSVPIRRNRKNMGALVALNKVSRPDFDSIDTKLLISVANEIAVYLDNFRLYKDLEDLLIGSLRALTSSIDAKDPYTCGHSERVGIIARWMCEQMEVSTEETHTIYLTGLLHDIGKIGVSESILCKPGRLVRDEMEQIWKHPLIGANILQGIRQMETVAKGVLTHHERYDGSGYPQGLKGKAIPFGGRVVMLADSFDAMISDRTYRKALPLLSALTEIRRFSGTQYDPDLAEIFLGSDIYALLDRLKTIHHKHQSLSNLKEPISYGISATAG